MMLRAAGCLTQDHDLGLIALAGLLCLLAVSTGVRLLAVGRATSPRLYSVRIGAAALAFSTGVGAAHLISILAFRPAVPFSFNLPMSSLSLTVLVLATWIGFTIRPTRFGSPREAVNNRLAIDARRFRTLADATFEGLILERDGYIVDVNRAMCELTETNATGLIGRSLPELIPGLDLNRSDGEQPVEFSLRLRRGQSLAIEALWRNGPDRGGHVLAVRGVSREQAPERQTERMALFDALTGLANRDLFEQKLHQAIGLAERTGGGIALHYIALDRFERADAAFGLLAAEQILVETAQRLLGTAGKFDIVARIGRDEFGIIQPLSDQPAGRPGLADRILMAMTLPFLVDDAPIVMSASVGVARYPSEGTTAEVLIKCATLALRQAKHDGPGRWRFFDPGVDLLKQNRLAAKHDLQIALDQNQFSLKYQPFMDAATLEVAGYEALLRWDHPERGRISPSDFIPLAEECGLIVPIGRWVLATACAAAASWKNPATISINLSPAQVLQPGIADTVADVLRETGLAAEWLELEITECSLIDNAERALSVMTSLKALGVKLSMDDFGTGHSSLSYLRKFPFDRLKIDRSFVSEVEDDSDAATIVQAIIGMSCSLRLDVTATGVETNQLATLRAFGSDFAQGPGRPSTTSQPDLHAAKPGQLEIEHLDAVVAAPVS